MSDVICHLSSEEAIEKNVEYLKELFNAEKVGELKLIVKMIPVAKKEELISVEEKDYIIGLCSDILSKKFLSRTDQYTIYRDLKRWANLRKKRGRSYAQKVLLGYLFDHKKESAKQSELVAVSRKILRELRQADEEDTKMAYEGEK